MSVDWNHIHVSIIPEKVQFTGPPRPRHTNREWYYKSLVDYDLWFCSKGQEMLQNHPDPPHRLQRGSVVLFRPQLECESWSEPGAAGLELYYMHFHLTHSDTGRMVDPSHLASLPFCFIPADIPYFEATCQKIISAVHLSNAKPAMSDSALTFASNLLKGLLLDIDMSSKIREQSSNRRIHSNDQKMVMDALLQINDTPQSFKGARDIAAAFSLSTDHFARIFKRISGISPSDALITSRIDRAKTLLSNSSLRIHEIAEQVGYDNTYFFCRQFKQRVGTTPGEFRAASSEPRRIF